MAQKRLQGGEGPEVALRTLDELQGNVQSAEDQEYLDAQRREALEAHQVNLGWAARIARTLSEDEELGRPDSDWTRPQDR